ncbi:ribosome small subunit-dependent GTPase A [Sporichthya brevicatena]|uniref:Small ribosomal subunit biogenesis GTPase RsgA n=1 Tax=Sporichthya brevicatena TaxID=171442 RepID=A0ABP3S5M1_9ACTN
MNPSASDPVSTPVPDAASDPDVLLALGWGADLGAAFERHRDPAVVPARVTRVDRGRLLVMTAAGPADALPTPGLAADSRDAACTGDWVALRRTPDGPSFVDAVLPRRTLLTRAVAGGESQAQPLAANADAIALVEGLDPTPSLSRIERLLVLLWETGATPLIVLTKADLVPDPWAIAERVAGVAAGVEVHVVSSATGDGYAALEPYVAFGRTLALLGRSGAGKSSLTNRLTGADLATQSIREDGRGRHTTVRRELVAVPGGGAVLDTPGLRAAGLWSAEEGVERVFGDIEALASECRFTDCGHESEPGCAVQAALADGRLEDRRWQSYRKLLREAEWIASRTDHRLRQERTRAWKQIHLEMRRNPKPGR